MCDIILMQISRSRNQSRDVPNAHICWRSRRSHPWKRWAKGGSLSNIESEADVDVYEVVVNHEEQYSIWLAERAVPSGWTKVGHRGSKSQCLDYIEKVWTDMRPLSVRNIGAHD